VAHAGIGKPFFNEKFGCLIRNQQVLFPDQFGVLNPGFNRLFFVFQTLHADYPFLLKVCKISMGHTIIFLMKQRNYLKICDISIFCFEIINIEDD